MEIVKGQIGNALESVAPDHVVATADAIYDAEYSISGSTGSYQSDINRDLQNKIVDNSIWTKGSGPGSAILTDKPEYARALGTASLVNGTGGEDEEIVASGDYSHAEGEWTEASGKRSHTEGFGTVASGEDSHAEGNSTLAKGEGSHAEGTDTEASGSFSHAEGNITHAWGDYSHAEGGYTVASNPYEHAQGKWNATASGQIFSIGVGTSNTARKNAISVNTSSNKIIFDLTVSASAGMTGSLLGTASFATSASKAVTASYALEAGNVKDPIWVRGTGSGSAVLSGSEATASGQFAIAHGTTNTDEDEGFIVASGKYSHAEGNGTRASGSFSHAEGESTVASGEGSHAEGIYTTASGSYSHAEGYNTLASRYYSHAEGYETVASGQTSHAEGDNTIASNAYEHAQGTYNATASGQIFSVGVGYYDEEWDTEVRKNAISVNTSSNKVIFDIPASASAGFTGSLLGTASFAVSASRAITASYASSVSSLSNAEIDTIWSSSWA